MAISDSTCFENSQFTYDGEGQCVKILEYSGGSLTSTKQFVWSFGPNADESRDGSGTVISQFFGYGQMDGSTKRFYNINQIDSVTDVTDNTGTLQGQLSYSPFGQPVQLQGNYVPDFGFGGYYLHARSGINLTLNRAYSANLGRWLNRDPAEEDAGTNLYDYVDNDPVNYTDPDGLGLITIFPIVPIIPVPRPVPAAGNNPNPPNPPKKPGKCPKKGDPPPPPPPPPPEEGGISGGGGGGGKGSSSGGGNPFKGKRKPADPIGHFFKRGKYWWDPHVLDQCYAKGYGDQAIEDALDYGKSWPIDNRGGVAFYDSNSGITVIVRNGVVSTCY